MINIHMYEKLLNTLRIKSAFNPHLKYKNIILSCWVRGILINNKDAGKEIYLYRNSYMENNGEFVNVKNIFDITLLYG